MKVVSSKIPYRNKSPHGWWIASYIERFEFDDEDAANLQRRCLAWENTILIQAKNRDEAYRKAMTRGRRSEGSPAQINSRSGRWRFEGLISLLPIYEELRDGAEVRWKEHANVTVRKVKSWIRQKKELETFDDREKEDEP
jgi:Domain of unknown function (DUF4288)